jgi:hypothetical protein
MTKVQIILPDQLAKDAMRAGLLSSEALETMLKQRLKAQAKADLTLRWAESGSDELTPEIEAEICEQVKLVRKQMRQRPLG